MTEITNDGTVRTPKDHRREWAEWHRKLAWVNELRASIGERPLTVDDFERARRGEPIDPPAPWWKFWART